MATRIETVNTYDEEGRLIRQVVTTSEVPDGPGTAEKVVPLAKGGIVPPGYGSGVATTRPADPYTITINLPGDSAAVARHVADALTRLNRERGA